MRSHKPQNELIHSQGLAVLYKPWGWTPLETLEKFRALNPKLKNEKMTYAGRLDPAAEGLLIVLYGKKVHDKEKYLKLDKTYEAEILFGFETDTWDLLGVVRGKRGTRSKRLKRLSVLDVSFSKRFERFQRLKRELNSLVGQHILPIPAYSSVPLNGKPLFTYARRGEKIKALKRVMEIEKMELQGMRRIPATTIENRILRLTKKVQGDFRQEKIAKSWKDVLKKTHQDRFIVVKIKLDVSSGTYIRSIAHELGERLDTAGILYSLKRTKIGTHKL